MIENVAADQAIDVVVAQAGVEHLDDGQAGARVECQRDVEFVTGLGLFVRSVHPHRAPGDQLERFDHPVADRGRAGAGVNEGQDAHTRDFFVLGFKLFDNGFGRFDDDRTDGAAFA